MRQPLPSIAVAVFAAALLSASPMVASAASRPADRTISESFDAADLDTLVFDMGIGEFELAGGSRDRVEVEVRIECNSRGWGSGNCEDRAEEIHLDSRRRGSRLELSLEGTGAWRNRGMDVRVTVRAPVHLAAEIDMAIGELRVVDMAGNLSIDLGIGEVSLVLPEETIGSIRADVGTGEATVRGATLGRIESAGLFVRELAWDAGPGTAAVRVDLGIGEISVRLR